MSEFFSFFHQSKYLQKIQISKSKTFSPTETCLEHDRHFVSGLETTATAILIRPLWIHWHPLSERLQPQSLMDVPPFSNPNSRSLTYQDSKPLTQINPLFANQQLQGGYVDMVLEVMVEITREEKSCQECCNKNKVSSSFCYFFPLKNN